MKHRIPALTLLLVVPLAGTRLCAQTETPAPADDGPTEEIGIDEKLGGTVALDVVLKDELGEDVTLKQLIDKPTILTLNYYSCAGICTPLLNGLQRVLNTVRPAPGKDFQVITVSFDPKDTPEIAQRKRTNYIKQMKRVFPPEAWRFLTGEAAATRTVCDSVGFKFRAEGRDFIHAGAIMFLSPEGKVTRYMYGTTFLKSDIEMALQEAEEGEPRPTISKLLQFCFSYDPEGKRYVFNMTKVVGAMTLVLVAGFLAFLLFKGKTTREKTAS